MKQPTERPSLSSPVNRRDALRAGGSLLVVAAPWLLGCKSGRRVGPEAGAPAPSARVGQCVETHDNIEGPYYRAGAPERWDLTESGLSGVPLEIEGRVTGLDCARGLSGVELDVWHATHDGHYDNDGTMPQGRMLLRGRLVTGADGHYRVRTIVPGRYLNGRQYRPAHVHVKLRAKDHAPLTTQLYFPGDPYNDVDPFIHPSLIMSTTKEQSLVRARFDFALRRA